MPWPSLAGWPNRTSARPDLRAPVSANEDSQILEVLLDMNENPRVPPNLRFDLREPSEINSALPPLDPVELQRRLQELRNDMLNGHISPEEFAMKADQLHAAHPIALSRTLPALEASVPHTERLPVPPPEGILLGDHAPGYMSPAHEEEYLMAMDAAIADPSYDPDAHDGRPLRMSNTHPLPSEKELKIQNPDSVYNWLRKNQPQVFLQDKDAAHPENASEKSSAKVASTGGRKRPSAAAQSTPGPKNDQEEEDGFVPEAGTAGSKRGRGSKDDDYSYRPKGGSSRPTKRKREDGDPATKSSRKKGRQSGGGATSTSA